MTPSGNPRRRSRDDVAEMALRLLDEHGLPDLTMRNLADALGVQPSALYWHFPNKQALLAAVSERILAPVSEISVSGAPTSGAPMHAVSVHDRVRELGDTLRACLLTYRDGAELVSSSLAFGLIESPVHPKLFEATRGAGIPEHLVRIAAETLTHYVVGYAFHEQQRLQADSLGLLPAGAELTPEAAVGSANDDGTGDFDAGVAMIADGFEAAIRASSTAG
ncbi:TetR/AcrR family transcriptional regulator C-terminal domain-containing protein [Humibacter soli]